jgi:Domain of unknown function (DUF1942)
LLNDEVETELGMRNVIALATAAMASTAVIALAGSVPAAADAASASFGSAQKVTDGNVVTSYTVSSPQPSSDTINTPVVGKLYSAKVSVQAVQGSSTPSIPFFNARTSSGDNYRVLWQAYAPNGLSGATLPPGGTASGNIYFDVTGAAPTTVAYNDGVQDRMVWGGSSSSTSGYSAAEPAAVPASPPAAPAPASRSCGSDLFTGMPIPCS